MNSSILLITKNFHASKKYLIELDNEFFDTKKWYQLNTFLWI